MGKFKAQTDAMSQDLRSLFNRSIRMTLRAGIAAAVNATKQDSSNAAFHWMIAEASKGRPGLRRLGKLSDLRQTKGVRGPARPKTGTVGLRGSGGKNRYATVNFVRTRESEMTINRVVAGRNPPGKFYFYNALHERNSSEMGAAELEEYAENVNLEEAGKAAVDAATEAFDRYFKNGQVRKR